MNNPCMNTDSAMRLDRLLTTLAFGSRREVQQIIRNGAVSIGGKITKTAAEHVPVNTAIFVNGKQVDARTKRHIMLNKPCGVLTAARDPKQPTVLDLFPNVIESIGCMPVGRLDKDTSGFLILTTDGELAHRLLSPKREIWKCYEATVDGPLDERDVKAFEKGLELSDFTALPARLHIIDSSSASSIAQVWVCEGKFHQVRRMFAARGRTVVKLKRLSIGPLKLDESLEEGEYRELTDQELMLLMQAVQSEKENPASNE